MFIISPVIKRIFQLLPSFFYMPILTGKMRGLYWVPKSSNPGQVFGRYEPEQEEKLSSLLKEVNIFWDVGAHVGWYSLMASKIISDGHIYCFEPHPENIKYIKRHIKINKINNIEIMPYALSSACGESYFRGDKQQGFLAEDGSLVVQTMTADEILKSTNIVPDIIKLDTEGAEVDFLKGAKTLLSEHQPILLLSAHGYKKRDECILFLERKGYQIEHLVSNKIEGDYVFIAKKH